MTADKPSSFHCPNCNALYRVVEVEPGPETVEREITCRSCGAPLASRKGNLVLKYSLVGKAGVLTGIEILCGKSAHWERAYASIRTLSALVSAAALKVS